MRYGMRLQRLQRESMGGDIHRVYAACGACGGLHTLNLAQVVAAGSQRACECVRCGCAASRAELGRIVGEYVG